MRRLSEIFILGVVLAAVNPSGTVLGAQDPPSPLEMTRKLIEESSAAKRIGQSGNAEAVARRQEARELLEQAGKAQADGDAPKVADLVSRARMTMLDAVRLAGPDESMTVKWRQDYDDRLESVEALMAAHDRVSGEKGAEAGSVDLRRLVDDRIAAAASLQGQGKLKEARGVLDEAYAAAKAAIEQLRGGDTLVRTLNFASKEEEYHYEIDRNDTHKMLVTVLLKEKIESDQRVKDNVRKFMDKAADDRKDAERLAEKGDFESAIRSLEQSTKEIVRAIRSAGIYIPG
jgi:hypothetical protein